MSDSETKHTQTPWKFSHAYVSGAERTVEITAESDEWRVGSLSCVLPNSPAYDGEREARLMADAAFIVRAANCHDELLAALPVMLSALERVTADFRRAVNGKPVCDMAECLAEVEHAEKQARAAIAKAKDSAA
jgi:hypothetical protein